MYVTPKRVSGLVVKTSIVSPLSVSNFTFAPMLFPIQFFCIVITGSGQWPLRSSRSFKSSSA